MDSEHPSLDTLRDIKRIMERSSRFISLSGLSGLGAGICALIGAYIAHRWIEADYISGNGGGGGLNEPSHEIKIKFILLAIGILIAAIGISFYFTWNKAKKNNLPVWDHTSRKLLINLMIPLAAGGFFVIGLLTQNNWRLVAPACLVFYGLALVNASKYTLTDIRYLGMMEIVLGLINIYYPEHSLYFWAFGFGVLHIVYGFIMWRKYDTVKVDH